MKLQNFFAVVASLACIALATPAAATIITATYTGTLRNGAGNMPTFGSASSLTGATFTSTYIFDSSQGVSTLNDNGSSTQEMIYGGSNWGSASPLVSASLTINGETLNFSGGIADQLLVYRQFDYFQFSQYVTNDPTDVSNNGFIYNTMMDNRSMSLPFDLHAPFSWDPSLGGSSIGEYFRYTNGSLDWYVEMTGTSLVVTTSNSTPLPEPSTFALLGLGLVGLGFARRTKR